MLEFGISQGRTRLAEQVAIPPSRIPRADSTSVCGSSVTCSCFLPVVPAICGLWLELWLNLERCLHRHNKRAFQGPEFTFLAWLPEVKLSTHSELPSSHITINHQSRPAFVDRPYTTTDRKTLFSHCLISAVTQSYSLALSPNGAIRSDSCRLPNE